MECAWKVRGWAWVWALNVRRYGLGRCVGVGEETGVNVRGYVRGARMRAARMCEVVYRDATQCGKRSRI